LRRSTGPKSGIYLENYIKAENLWRFNDVGSITGGETLKFVMIVLLAGLLAFAGCAQQTAKPAPTAEKPAVEPAAPAAPAASTEEGKNLFNSKGCSACHGTNGEGVPGVGPKLSGLYGSEVMLQDGSEVTADDAFLKESIVKPDAKVVKGYSAMPNLGVSDSDAAAIVEYIKTLK
jgi:mono/diheme cytochrome c family protein